MENKHGGRGYWQRRTDNFTRAAMFGRKETRGFKDTCDEHEVPALSLEEKTNWQKNIAASSFSSNEAAQAAARSCSLGSSQIWSQLSGKQDR